MAENVTGYYLEVLTVVERMHRQFLEALKAELDALGRTDINNVQALLLFNVGDDQISVGELTSRGYYLGSNVTYNLKKLVENEYLTQKPSPHVRRSSRIEITEKGRKLWQQMADYFNQQGETLAEDYDMKRDQLVDVVETLRTVERYWRDNHLI